MKRAIILSVVAGLIGGAALIARRKGIHPVGGPVPQAWVYERTDEMGQRIRVLRSGGVYQSATYVDAHRFEPVFPYIRAFDVIRTVFPAAPARSRVVMLGGGCCSYPKHVLSECSYVSLDVVEPDAAVVSAARRWFYLDELERNLKGMWAAQHNSLTLHLQDGRAYLEELASASAHQFHAVINDAFCGEDPVCSLATVEAARLVSRILDARGLYVLNVVSRNNGTDLRFLQQELATLREVFSSVHVILIDDNDLAGEDNYLVCASNVELELAEGLPYDELFLGEVLRDSNSR